MLYNGILTKLDSVRTQLIDAIRSKGGTVADNATLKECKEAVQAMPNWETNNPSSVINPVFNGLVFYLGCNNWMKDEISGAEIPFANISPKPGKHEQCAYFDGATSWAALPKDQASIKSKSAWSMGLWFKPEALTQTTINPIYAERNESSYGSSRFSVQLTNDLKIFSQVNFTDGQEEVDLLRAESVESLSIGTWYFITVTVDLISKKMVLYIDGLAVATSTNEAAPDAAPDSLPYVDPQIMSWMDDMKYYTHGSLDELAMWDRALTALEVSILYNSGNGLFYPDTTSSGSTTDIYKCQAVSEDKTTWSGYPCTYHEGEKRYYVSSQVVDNLTCDGPLTPIVGNYYDYRCRFSCYTPFQGNGLLAYFPLTRDVKDHSGNGYHADPTGPLEFHTIYGVSTNRNDDATLTFPALESIKGFNVSDGDFTFSFWYRMRVRSGYQQRIMIDKKSMNESKFMFAMWDGRFRFHVLGSCRIDNSTYESGWTEWSDDIPINQIVITRLTDVIYIYRNAECISNFGATGKVFDIIPYLGQYSFDRGCNSYTYISDMRMYSTGMSAEQVQNMYQVGRFNGI